MYIDKIGESKLTHSWKFIIDRELVRLFNKYIDAGNVAKVKEVLIAMLINIEDDSGYDFEEEINELYNIVRQVREETMMNEYLTRFYEFLDNNEILLQERDESNTITFEEGLKLAEEIEESYSKLIHDRVRQEAIDRGDVEAVEALEQEMPYDFDKAYTQEELLGKEKEDRELSKEVKDQKMKIKLEEQEQRTGFKIDNYEDSLFYTNYDTGQGKRYSKEWLMEEILYDTEYSSKDEMYSLLMPHIEKEIRIRILAGWVLEIFEDPYDAYLSANHRRREKNRIPLEVIEELFKVIK